MEQLLKGTTAFKIFAGDVAHGRLSHAYMLYFNDTYNLRGALKLLALQLFGADRDSRDGKLILEENFSDLKVYPQPDKKLSVADATDIIDDSTLRPLERDKKLYIISDFDTSAPLFQNKLLKILEEPPEGVYFILGTTSLAPVLDTIRSRVKMLEVPPFSTEQIYSALLRQGDNPKNMQVAQNCGGCLGEAQNMLSSDWYEQVTFAAKEIFEANSLADAGELSIKYGDFKYKNQLLASLSLLYFEKLKKMASLGDSAGATAIKSPLIYAIESLNQAVSDVKFNANFSALLYDFAVRVVQEKQRWKKLLV